MGYETLIGWRYLYRGSRSRRSALGFWISLAAAVLGACLFFGVGPGVVGIVLLVGGAVGAVVFGLLHLFSVFTTVSTLGVVFGVAALTVVLAVTSGFQTQFREKVLGVNAHVLVMKNTQDFADYDAKMDLARGIDPEVLAVQPFVFVEMLVTRGKGEIAGVAIKGVDPDAVTDVLDLHKHMVEGSVASLAGGRPRPAARGGAGAEPAPAGAAAGGPAPAAPGEATPGAPVDPNDAAPADVLEPEDAPVGPATAADADEPPPVIIGRVLAEKLNASVGDIITVVSPLSHIDVNRWTPTGKPPKTKPFRVTGIFYAGFDEYDRRLMYINLRDAQDLLEQGDVVMGIEMRVANVDRADVIANELDEALGGPPFIVQDWRELNRNLFTALTLQKIALLIVLTLIIAVAAFNMVSALTMMVIDKTREVAILKSMGATSGGVSTIFQLVGVLIGTSGTVAGLSLGLLVCEVVARLGYRLDPRVYLIDRLPIQVNPLEVVGVALITMAISAVATVLPARRASSLAPVDGLRYE